jgi:hypothetical protein
MIDLLTGWRIQIRILVTGWTTPVIHIFYVNKRGENDLFLPSNATLRNSHSGDQRSSGRDPLCVPFPWNRYGSPQRAMQPVARSHPPIS